MIEWEKYMKELNCRIKSEVGFEIFKGKDFAKKKKERAWKINTKKNLFSFQKGCGMSLGRLYSIKLKSVEIISITVEVSGFKVISFLLIKYPNPIKGMPYIRTLFSHEKTKLIALNNKLKIDIWDKTPLKQT